MVTACVQRMAHAVLLGTGEGVNSKRHRDSVCRRTRTGANTGACLSQERVIYTRTWNRTGGLWERCTVWYARSRRSLPNRPMPPAYISSPADFGSEKDIRCLPISRRFSVPADKWWGAKPLAERGTRPRGWARGGGGGGQDRRPTDNNSLQQDGGFALS